MTFIPIPSSNLFPSIFPLPPKADPEGDENELHIQPEGLLPDVKEIIAKLLPRGDILRSVYGGNTS
jgi:hypothetical protein